MHSIADLFARKLAYSDQESTEMQGALSPSEKVQLPFPNEVKKLIGFMQADRIYPPMGN